MLRRQGHRRGEALAARAWKRWAMQTTERTTDTVALGVALMALAGLGMVGYAAWFIVQNFTGLIEIGLSLAEVDKTEEQIRAFSPDVYEYISHLQVNLGGFMAATGLAIALLAWFGVRRRESWAWWGVVLTTLLWAVVGLPIHYAYGFGALAHIGPGYLAVALVSIGAYLARSGRWGRLGG